MTALLENPIFLLIVSGVLYFFFFLFIIYLIGLTFLCVHAFREPRLNKRRFSDLNPHLDSPSSCQFQLRNCNNDYKANSNEVVLLAQLQGLGRNVSDLRTLVWKLLDAAETRPSSKFSPYSSFSPCEVYPHYGGPSKGSGRTPKKNCHEEFEQPSDDDDYEYEDEFAEYDDVYDHGKSKKAKRRCGKKKKKSSAAQNENISEQEDSKEKENVDMPPLVLTESQGEPEDPQEEQMKPGNGEQDEPQEDAISDGDVDDGKAKEKKQD
ncbi:hypothetical protein M011DRAFT_462650 [Sporormia fimetaria CBS 119925]|uniref:Uncharacterized protein n=1 Tax=Sporormia fimetaria CBS 119925 TaxID=1340428 RepID=A0A6A6UXG3_9PLEO|nr:hypothetical protein M011DRAFT_462650 [Sporormia fimetaria CBS 119925]